MAEHSKLAPFILKWEGGYVNDPLDRGGATNRGVTLATYQAFRKKLGYLSTTEDDLKKMTSIEWQRIFKELYWDRWRADSIENQSVAELLVDWVWASGVHGIKIPQRLLGVEADGVVGTKTIAAVNGADPRGLFTRIQKARLDFVDDIVRRNPSQQRFIKGWKNRINNIKFKE